MFTKFLESIKTPENDALIESIAQGYSVLHESHYQLSGDDLKSYRSQIPVDALHDNFIEVAKEEIIESIASQLKAMAKRNKPDYKLLKIFTTNNPMVNINDEIDLPLKELPGYDQLLQLITALGLELEVVKTKSTVNKQREISKKNTQAARERKATSERRAANLKALDDLFKQPEPAMA